VTETQTVDLAAWLTAIWDEEERLASEWQSKLDAGVAIPSHMLGGVVNPASVLARIAADRRILELHGVAWNAEVCTVCHHPHEDGETLDNDAWPCATVRLLASPYKGREGWQEAWADE